MALSSSAITTTANKPPLSEFPRITLKRLIPFIACLITYAHAQVETFNLTYTLRVQDEAPSSTDDKKPVSFKNLNHAVLTLEKRLKALKAKKTKVKAKGSDRILVTVNQLSDAEIQELRTTLTRPAKLELKLVHPDTRKLANKVAADPDNEIVPGYELKVLRDTDDDGNITSENILIKNRAALDGSYIIHAKELDGPYEGQILIELNEQGADLMFKTTDQMKHGRDRLAIVIDGKVLSAPTVQSTLSKKFQVSGLSSEKEAKALAAALLNPLKNPLIIEEEKRTPSHLITDPSKKAAP
jgi:SecD/SecF fusion protein